MATMITSLPNCLHQKPKTETKKQQQQPSSEKKAKKGSSNDEGSLG